MTLTLPEIREHLHNPDDFEVCDYGLIYKNTTNVIGVQPYALDEFIVQLNGFFLIAKDLVRLLDGWLKKDTSSRYYTEVKRYTEKRFGLKFEYKPHTCALRAAGFKDIHFNVSLHKQLQLVVGEETIGGWFSDAALEAVQERIGDELYKLKEALQNRGFTVEIHGNLLKVRTADDLIYIEKKNAVLAYSEDKTFITHEHALAWLVADIIASTTDHRLTHRTYDTQTQKLILTFDNGALLYVNLHTGRVSTNVGYFTFNVSDLDVAGAVLSQELQTITVVFRNNNNTATFVGGEAQRLLEKGIRQGVDVVVTDTKHVTHDLETADIEEYELLWS